MGDQVGDRASDVPVAVRKGSQDAYERPAGGDRRREAPAQRAPRRGGPDPDAARVAHGRAHRARAPRAGGPRRARAEPRREGAARRRARGGRDPRDPHGARRARRAVRGAERDEGSRSPSCGRSSRRCGRCSTRATWSRASELNAKLHARLLEIAGHRTVSRLVATLSSQLVRFQYRTILAPGRAEQSHAEHRAIVDAVAKGDADAAEQAVREHLAHVVAACARSDGRTSRRRSVASRPAMNETAAETRVAIIGIGEAGAEIARDLVAAGCSVRAADPNPAREVPGAELVGSTADAVRGAELVLSLTTAAAARAAATAAAPALRPGAVYADLNTGSAQLKRDVAATVERARRPLRRRGGDGARAGPRPAHAAARLGLRRRAVRGAAAAARRAASRCWAASRERPPRASSLRSVFMKGLAAALLEGARRRGRPAARSGSGRTPPRHSPRPTGAWSTGSWRAAACTPARRVHELDCAAELLRELGVAAARDERGRGLAGSAELARMSVEAACPPSPSARARSLRGAFDTHVHIAPDVVERRIDDLTLARRFAELGLGGFQLKSHYTSTAERAAVVRAAVPGVEVLGAIALNRAVGGHEPASRSRSPRARARAPSGSRRSTPSTRAARRRSSRRGRGSRSGWSSSASCARRGSSSSRCRSSTRTAPCCPRRARCSA